MGAASCYRKDDSILSIFIKNNYLFEIIICSNAALVVMHVCNAAATIVLYNSLILRVAIVFINSLGLILRCFTGFNKLVL